MEELIFTFKLGKKEHTVDLNEDLMIGDDPKLAMQDHAEKFAKYSILTAAAKKQLDTAVENAKQIAANVGVNIRGGGPDAEEFNPKGLKLTEGAIEELIRDSEPYALSKRKVVEAQYIYDIVSSAKEAFNQRATMIMFMGADDFSQQIRLLTSNIQEKLRKTVSSRG